MISVLFRHSASPYPYCSWHAFNQWGRLRWDERQIRSTVGRRPR